jgi:hypothetical protein
LTNIFAAGGGGLPKSRLVVAFGGCVDRSGSTILCIHASLMVLLKGFEKEVEVNGRRYVVRVTDGSGGLRKNKNILLKLRITAEVNGVKSNYIITFRRRGNKDVGYAYAKADAPGGREVDVERLVAVIKALTDREPKVYRMKDGRIMIICNSLRDFARYRELSKYVVAWIIVV